MKKIKSVMLVTATTVLLLLAFCFSASAAEWKNLDGECRYSVDEETGIMVVNGEGHLYTSHFGLICRDHYDYDYFGVGSDCSCVDYQDTHHDFEYPGYDDACATKILIIQEGITSIEVQAFTMFSNLEVIIFPQSVTEIPAGAFYGLKKLHTVVLSDSTTAIGKWAFGYCKNLRSIYIPESVKTIQATAFTGCDMSNIKIPATVKMAPEMVTKVQATAITDTTITLSWSKSERATGYRVFQKVSSGWKILGTVNKLSGTIKNLKPGKKYVFVVQAYTKHADGEVLWSEYEKYSFRTPSATAVAKVSSPSKGKITLSWNSAEAATGYQIWYKKGNGSYKLYKSVANPATMSFSGLKSGTKYTFAVRSYWHYMNVNNRPEYVYGDYKPVTVTVK